MSKISCLIKSDVVKVIIIIVLVAVVAYGGLQLVQSQGWFKDAPAAVVEDVPAKTTD